MSEFNLFIYKLFSSSDLIQFSKKLFTLIVSKEFIKNNIYKKKRKKINRNTNFSKINYKNVSIFFFYLPEIIYCLFLLKKNLNYWKKVYSILLGLKVNK